MRFPILILSFLLLSFVAAGQDSMLVTAQDSIASAQDSTTAVIVQNAAPVQQQAYPLVNMYGIQVPIDTVALKRSVVQAFDSTLFIHPLLQSDSVVYAIEEPRPMPELTTDFYLLVALCIVLGLIRTSDPKYFSNLWRAFRSPSLSGRVLRDKLESATMPNLLMNIFFTMTAGAYFYYLLPVFSGQLDGGFHSSVMLLIVTGSMMLIYLGKYVVIRFSGWAFKVEGITDHYLFNVFLINKIISIVLLPFIILLAFANPGWREPIVILSLIILGLLLANRYLRSWQVFSSFFQYSKFHFFTYLCASELLPLAVLMKLLVRGMYYN